jgi:hypothetical protein
MPAVGKTRGPDRKTLQGQLEYAIRTALQHSPEIEELPSIPALSAIESQAPNRILVLRRNLTDILRKLDETQPKTYSAGGGFFELVEGIKQTQETVAEFSKILEVIAALPDTEAAMEVDRWFGNVLQRYYLPKGFSGSFSYADQDYFKFLGHELFVTMIAFLLKDQRWELLARLLIEPIPIRYIPRLTGPGTVNWTIVSDHMAGLIEESRRGQRMSLHADILYERHTKGGLAAIMPIDDFMEADYFLFLAAELPQPDDAVAMEWRPWSDLYLKHTPLFLRNAERKETTDQLAKVFNVPDAQELRRRIIMRAGNIRALFNNGMWIDPVSKDELERIGTRP